MPDDVPKSYRNIVLCFDGTGDWVEDDRTNVAKIFENLDRSDQLCFYDAGIGTLGDSQALGDAQEKALKTIDLATATGMGDKVTQAYAYLVRHYRPGVKIYLIGFSRGAFTARILAAMLLNFGLLRPELEHLAPYFYQSIASVSDIGRFKRNANRLRRVFGRTERVKIEFMGLFDTVSSVGIVERFRVYPNTDHNEAVLRTCHAVSIEETRNAFPELLMHPGQPNLTEVWFPGVHRDCGGGVTAVKSRIADEALFWIETEAHEAGLGLLALDPPDRTVAPDPNYSPQPDPYVLFGLYPQRMFSKRVSDFRVFWPNLRHVRVIPEGALVHEIVNEAYPAGGFPPNTPDRWTLFQTGDKTLSQGPYVLRQVGINPEDALGTILGGVLLLQFWNAEVGQPLGITLPGDSKPIRYFPTPLGWVELLLVVAFLLVQMLGKGQFPPVVRARVRPWIDRALPIAGVAVLIFGLGAIVVPLVRYHALPEGGLPVLVGLSVGAIAWATAQWGPLPVVRADRTLPYLLRNVFYAALSLRLLDGIVRWWIPEWSAPIEVKIVLLVVAVALALLGIAHDRPIMGRSKTKEAPPQARGPSSEGGSGIGSTSYSSETIRLMVVFPAATLADADVLDRFVRTLLRLVNVDVDPEGSRSAGSLILEYHAIFAAGASIVGNIESVGKVAEGIGKALDLLQRLWSKKEARSESLTLDEAIDAYGKAEPLFRNDPTILVNLNNAVKIALKRANGGEWIEAPPSDLARLDGMRLRSDASEPEKQEQRLGGTVEPQALNAMETPPHG